MRLIKQWMTLYMLYSSVTIKFFFSSIFQNILDLSLSTWANKGDFVDLRQCVKRTFFIFYYCDLYLLEREAEEGCQKLQLATDTVEQWRRSCSLLSPFHWTIRYSPFCRLQLTCVIFSQTHRLCRGGQFFSDRFWKVRINWLCVREEVWDAWEIAENCVNISKLKWLAIMSHATFVCGISSLLSLHSIRFDSQSVEKTTFYKALHR